MKFKLCAAIAAAASFGVASGAISYTSTTATTAWNAGRWNNASDSSPYTSAFTANNDVSFTSGTYTFAGMGATTNVGNVTVASGVTVNFASIGSTFATGGQVRTIDVGSGGLFDLNGNSVSTAAGTGLIKNGSGVFGTGAGSFTGGFTLNAGTVIARGTTGLGSGATNVLSLNGGTLASNASRSFDNTRFGGGIVIGGDVQFGEVATVVALANSTANLSFANNVNLGSANRMLTQGNNGTHTFSGVISNVSGGITFAANASTDGRFDITNTANTFTGDINLNGGEVRFSADGSMGNTANDIIIDGGRFGIASGATLTLGGERQIFVGDAAGSGISAPGAGGLLTYNGVIANKSGEVGSWAKQGQGTLSLGGISTYTGDTAINNGTLQLTTGNDRLPTGTVVSMGQSASANLGTLDFNGRNQQIAGLNSTSGTNATTANNTVTSATATTLTIGGSGIYSFGDGSNANSGVITGAVSLVKSGSGTQTLGDTNTYTGTTTVSAGSLYVNGSLSNTSSTTVADSATLGGTGSIANGVSVASGGTLAVGLNDSDSSIGTLTLGGLALSGLLEMGATGELTYDKLITTGAFSVTGGTIAFRTSGYTIAHNTSFDLANFTGTASGATFDFSGAAVQPYGAWDTSAFASTGVITYVPEPGAALLGGIGLLLLLRRRR